MTALQQGEVDVIRQLVVSFYVLLSLGLFSDQLDVRNRKGQKLHRLIQYILLKQFFTIDMVILKH